MFPELPAEGSVSLLFAMGFVAVCGVFTVSGVAVGRVGTVGLVQGLGVFPLVALAGDGAEKESGGGGEERGRFHPAAGCSGSPADGKRRKRRADQGPSHFAIADAARR